MSFKLLLSSLSRTSSSTSSSNFVVNLPNNLYLKSYKYIRLVYVGIFNTIYNVDATNNAINFRVGATTYSTTVSPGIYNANTLATTLQTAMTAQLANAWSVVYNQNQLTYTISGTSAFLLLFSSGASASTSLWRVLGYANSTGTAGTDTGSATSTTSTQVGQFIKPLYVCINLNSICADQIYSTVPLESFTFILSVDTAGGSLIEYDANSNFDQYIKIPDNLNTINALQVSLSFNGSSANLNGSEWYSILEFCNEML